MKTSVRTDCIPGEIKRYYLPNTSQNVIAYTIRFQDHHITTLTRPYLTMSLKLKSYFTEASMFKALVTQK